MTAFSNATESDLIAFILNATAIPWAAASNLFVALHTADPGEDGNQGTSEATYAGYARVQVARTSGGWTVNGSPGLGVNAALIQFPQCTSGSNTITHVSIGTASTGAGQILVKGALSSSLNVSAGIQPQFAASALTLQLN
jgi:hypothetical protein